MAKLTGRDLKEALAANKTWAKKGNEIMRCFEFKDFGEALKFVNKVGRLAEKANHHPDIDIRWNKVTLKLSTHSEGGLTEKDFQLAHKITPLADDR